MSNLNVVALTGRLTADPELRHTQSDLAVCSFSLAVDGIKKDSPADFIDCTAWRQTAEFVSRYFDKGSMIAIQGHLHTDTYTDKDGNKRKKTEVVVDNVSFCGSKGNSSSSSPAPQKSAKQAKPEYSKGKDSGGFESLPDDSDLPF
ncbi:single-stranded DNA-binding protein [Caproicibacterium amylolyticum]|uniref:Single-stranded DNA-binding protein n=1 Tax=Caproicibacterium amylolyticum TaxID=2766537 RepID=A0A7G9WJW6_9FIRM|nr:single-stranded DNA-binding protein [Caproicibacterium amylolyticum]QNO18978.1 single-stranded DNA-binding protein [Caproicibacterium amylolyticum]